MTEQAPVASAATSTAGDSTAPWPGSHQMPRWNLNELPAAPRFTWKNWAMMLGPGLVLGGAAIGGGEWLTGPMVTARYGGGLLWLATLSILGQVIYNLEISRYTLYTGEPIFTGKFRTPPGPMVWVLVYLLLDFGSVFPYLAAFAATPLATIILGEVPTAATGQAMLQLFGTRIDISHEELLRYLGYAIFLGALVPLIFGGKVFNALKVVMGVKIVLVLGFLLVLGVFYSQPSTWTEIFSGFVRFGNVPVRQIEDSNGNGVLDPGEDWDGDGRLDTEEPLLDLVFPASGFKPPATDIDLDGQPDPMVAVSTENGREYWPDFDGDGQADSHVALDINGDGVPDGPFALDADQDGRLDAFIDIDQDGIRDGDNVQNIFAALFAGRPLPKIDWSMIAFLSALVAISGSGGLSNTPISNYTRDQGWGMGHHVGAIPSIVGGQDIQLSHVGTVFEPNSESLPRWKRWYKHIVRDQLIVWMPACFFGLALPSLLSVEFLDRGTVVDDQWAAAVLTADGVESTVGTSWGTQWGACFGFLTLFCGFLVLAPSMSTSADGVIRRWVDVFWTASPRLRQMNPRAIRYVYFVVLAVYTLMGLMMLCLEKPESLLLIATTIYNFALGISCIHTLVVNCWLLPKELQPNWFSKLALGSTGLFFFAVACLSTLAKFS
ncbi:MAG: Nramp family divalent metal transporter [Planctomycetaceae bacterium]|nr:Nramp family divalent metal transporter [Planctomycetaceae bacterium]